ncbi:MAG: adenylate/guanylate cyclase domain-containing protein [Pseudomonadota bacterium]|nr:adenylate/guanylate cyclase domain-containing protein [Pseudomonadota bacterium]
MLRQLEVIYSVGREWVRRMTVSYELYTLVNGRWQIYVRHEEGRREDAMAEAKTLEIEPQIERVRVVRDQYDPETNESRETTVYETFLPGDGAKSQQDDQEKSEPQVSKGKADVVKDQAPIKNKRTTPSEKNETALEPSPQIKEKKAPNNSSRQSSEAKVAGAEKTDAQTNSRVSPSDEQIKQERTVAGGVIQLAIAISLSTFFSLIAGSAAFYGLNALHESRIWVFQSPYLFWGLVGFCFILAFFAAFRPMFRKVDFGPSDENLTVQRTPAQIKSDVIHQVRQLQASPDIDLSNAEEKGGEANPINWPKSAENVEIVERTLNGPQHLKDASGWLLSCMTEGMKIVPDILKKLDAFNRFGLTLFFAGAGDFVGTRYRCDQRQRADMLTDRMQLLGHDENTAFAFCANIDEYLMQPKYLKMYDLGRTAMKNFIEDQTVDLKLEEAIRNWNKPAGSAEEENEAIFVVVLFTDIVNSTAQTQEIGDEGAMEVVRAHNQIIREALSMYQGTEVKHMGDGIMAVFPNVPNSVQAAIQMQFGIDAYCKTTSDRQFRCRIGINAGEPIREGQDYFGTPVQLAARVMSKAESDEIAVSQIVQTMCPNTDISFKNVGEFELKGFDEPMVIYHVNYRAEQAAAAE